MALEGPRLRFPLSGCSKKQTAVSHSTPEAEIIACAFGLRTEGIPAMQLWDVLLGWPVDLQCLEDNQAMMRVVETGRNPTLRYIGRTHGVSIAWLHEQFKDKHQLMTYCESSKQAGDIYTKPFIDAAKWESVCDLIGVCHPSRLHALIRHFVAS